MILSSWIPLIRLVRLEGLFTREFYGNCYNALQDDGIMVNQQGSPFYAEDAHAMQRSHKRIASTLSRSAVFIRHTSRPLLQVLAVRICKQKISSGG